MSRTIIRPPRPARGIVWGASLLALIILAACAGDPFRPGPGGPEDREYRDYGDFIVTTAREGDAWTSLAARFLGDPADGWKIARFNDMEAPTPGRELVVPRIPFGRGGLKSNGFQTVPVLVYHRFSRDKSDKLIVTEEAFKAQMNFLKEDGWTVISLERFFDFLDFKAAIPEKSVVLTFNDGWRSLYEIAYPVLKAHGHPATLFVYTDFISGGKSMSWDQIKELSENGFDIQSLTRSHRNLAKMKKGETFQAYFNALVEEIAAAEKTIERSVGVAGAHLAFPYGASNNLVRAILKKRGYRGAFTVSRGANPFFIDNFRVRRSVIYGEFDLEKFKENLTFFIQRDLEPVFPDDDAASPGEAEPLPAPGPLGALALAMEETGDLYMARCYWKAAATTDPGSAAISERIRALETRRFAAAQRRVEKGDAYFKKKKTTAARAAFLAALRRDPDNERALLYVKEKLNGKKEAVHLVKKGDDLKTISREFYRDPDKDFLIAWFNDMAPGEAPRPGARLRLPLLPASMTGKVYDIEKEMAAAGALLNEQRYPEAAAAAKKILKHEPGRADAVDLMSAAHLGMGAALLREDKPREALAMAEKILAYDPDNEDAMELMYDAWHREGVTLLKEGKTLAALSLAQKILKKDPGNDVGVDMKNAVYYQMGKNLLQEDKPREALKMFELAAPDYKDVGALISGTRQSLEARADIHYRNGVKHFVHERLEGAIMEWSKALALDPDHKKAKRDLENARKLLEKLKMIE
ncbi:MAG: polysaccharide deacetylase family protein [Desulfobacterales bacterium]|nr:polysaccharide deacetylase family protein [Desulfobacterales bacterium]